MLIFLHFTHKTFWMSRQQRSFLPRSETRAAIHKEAPAMPHKPAETKTHTELSESSSSSMNTNEISSPVKMSQPQHPPSLSPASIARHIQALRNQGLPYTSTSSKKHYSLEEWLSKLDNIIEDSTNGVVAARRHSLPPSQHKRSLSDGVEVTERPRKRARRRNSFVIHRDANGHNVSLLHSVPEQQDNSVDEERDAQE